MVPREKSGRNLFLTFCSDFFLNTDIIDWFEGIMCVYVWQGILLHGCGK